MRRAANPRILAADSSNPQRTRSARAADSHDDAMPSDFALDQPATPTGPVPAEEGIAMEDTSFQYDNYAPEQTHAPDNANDLDGVDPAVIPEVFCDYMDASEEALFAPDPEDDSMQAEHGSNDNMVALVDALQTLGGILSMPPGMPPR